MNNIKLLPICILLISFGLISKDGYSQKRNSIGITLRIETTSERTDSIDNCFTKTAQKNWNPTIGFSYERIISKHFQLGIELNYRQYKNELAIPIPYGSNSTAIRYITVTEAFITMPIQVKYKSNILNISLGPTLDYYLSWKQEKDEIYNFKINSYERFFNQKISLGLLGSVSKSLDVNNQISIEPSFYYNQIFSFTRAYYGFAIATRFKF